MQPSLILPLPIPFSLTAGRRVLFFFHVQTLLSPAHEMHNRRVATPAELSRRRLKPKNAPAEVADRVQADYQIPRTQSDRALPTLAESCLDREFNWLVPAPGCRSVSRVIPHDRSMLTAS